MKIFLIVFLFLNNAFYSQAENTDIAIINENPDISGFNIITSDHNSILFKAWLKYRHYDFSGLVFLSKTEENSETHIVFMTEFGLTMLQLKYFNDEFIIVECKELFDNRRLLSSLKNAFRLIVQDFRYIDNFTIIDNENEIDKSLSFKHLSHKYFYNLQRSTKSVEIRQKRFIFTKLEAEIIQSSERMPQKIAIKNPRGSLSINMELIEVK